MQQMQQPVSVVEGIEVLNWMQENAGWGWTVGLVAVCLLGGGWLWFWWKKYRPLKAQAVPQTIRVLSDRSKLTSAFGTLDDELTNVTQAWVVWPCGTVIPGLNKASISKIDRAIFTDIIKPVDFAPYAKMMTLGSHPFRQNLYQATAQLRDAGHEVKWHRHPTTSMLIGNPTSDGGWARLEILLPYTRAADRMSMVVYRSKEPEVFKGIVEAFEAMWKESVEPVSDPVEIPGGKVFTTSSGGY